MKNGWGNESESMTHLMQAVHSSLQAQVSNLTPSELQRLEQLRQRALQMQAQPTNLSLQAKGSAFLQQRGLIISRPLVQGFMVAVVSVMAVSWLFHHNQTVEQLPSATEPANSVLDFMMSEDTEFLDHLEVYEWLASEYS